MSHRRPPHRWARRAAGLAVALCAATGLSAVAAPSSPAHAAIEDRAAIGYNMQGSTGKLSNDVFQLTQRAPVVALQEAGTLEHLRAEVDYTWGTPINHAPYELPSVSAPPGVEATQVHEFTWQPFTETQAGRLQPPGQRTRLVYFMETGGPNAKNLAMVTWEQAKEVVFFEDTGHRPAFGLVFGDTLYVTVHAASGSGFDLPSMTQQVAAYAAQRGWQWIVIGDANRDPRGGFGIPDGSHIYYPDRATQQSGNTLDYAIASREIVGYSAEVQNGISSDHWPVMFGVNLTAGGEPPTIAPPPLDPGPIGPGPLLPPPLPGEGGDLPIGPGPQLPCEPMAPLCEVIG